MNGQAFAQTMKAAIAAFIVLLVFAVCIAGFWPWISTTFLPESSWGLYQRGFFESLIVEVHGVLVEVLVVAIVLYAFERRSILRSEAAQRKAEKSAAIERNLELLSDLRFYRASDGPFRALNAMRRLLSLGAQRIAAPEVNLSGTQMDGMELRGANLVGASFKNSLLSSCGFKESRLEAADFSSAKLRNVNFSGSHLMRAKFVDTGLPGCDFSNTRLERADFSNANLRSAIFVGANCQGATFAGADLRSANFRGAKNVTQQMLSLARNVQDIKLDIQ